VTLKFRFGVIHLANLCTIYSSLKCTDLKLSYYAAWVCLQSALQSELREKAV